jgi:hypothetical protein
MAANYKLSDTLNFVLPMVNYYPLTIGSSQQPFLGMCCSVAQVMLAPPFRHNFNRTAISFKTVSGTQTYVKVSAWVGNTPYVLGNVVLDSNNNGQKCTTAGTSSGSAPTWATGIFANTTDNTIVWQNIGPLTSIAQVNDFSYIEKAQVQDINNGNAWKDLSVNLNIGYDSDGQSCPKYISPQSDDNAGDVSFRLTPTPGAVYPIHIIYQKLQVPFTSLGQTWAPIPDRLFYTYSYGVLALSYLYKGDARFAWASSQFITKMLSYAEGLDETQISQFLRNWQGTIAEESRTQKMQQGNAARGQG